MNKVNLQKIYFDLRAYENKAGAEEFAFRQGKQGGKEGVHYTCTTDLTTQFDEVSTQIDRSLNNKLMI